MTTAMKTGVRTLILLGAGAALAGCMGPTYGTGQTATQQLFDDLDGIASFADPRPQRDNISYEERPELVRPESTNVLPTPQAPRVTEVQEGTQLQRDAALAARGGPVSPELAAARDAMRADSGPPPRNGFGATQYAGQRASDFASSPAELRGMSEEAQRFRAANATTSNERRYLSEPPTTYRQPAATAPVGETGIDERVKEARVKREENSLGSKLRGILPF